MNRKSFFVAYATTIILATTIAAMLGVAFIALIVKSLDNAGLGTFKALCGAFTFIGSAIFATNRFLRWSYDHPHKCVTHVIAGETIATCLLLCGADMWLFITAAASTGMFHIAWGNARMKLRNLVFRGDAATELSAKIQPMICLAGFVGCILGGLMPTDILSVGLLRIAASLGGLLEAIVQLRYLEYFLAKGIVFDKDTEQ